LPITAVYWKNGQALRLTDRQNESEALSIFVTGSDVYAAGAEEINGTSTTTYWKNGEAVRLR
jgi:hypothetical protein